MAKQIGGMKASQRIMQMEMPTRFDFRGKGTLPASLMVTIGGDQRLSSLDRLNVFLSALRLAEVNEGPRKHRSRRCVFAGTDQHHYMCGFQQSDNFVRQSRYGLDQFQLKESIWR
jgi:hypothetical protein